MRATSQDLAHALDMLEQLAYRYESRNNANAWPEIASLLDFLLFLDRELEIAKKAAPYPPGTDAHTIGRHGLNRPVEERLDFGTDIEDEAAGNRPRRRLRPELSDQLCNQLRGLRRGCESDLRRLLYSWQSRAGIEVNWPTRSKEIG